MEIKVQLKNGNNSEWKMEITIRLENENLI